MTELLIALAVMVLSVFLVLAMIISGEHISDSIDEYRFGYEGRKSGGDKRIGMNYKQFKRLVESGVFMMNAHVHPDIISVL